MNILFEIKQLIYESYIFNDSNISVDLNKFESGQINKLLITGLSGAGKTSIGKQLSKEYNCPIVDTDIINFKILEKYPEDKFSNSDRLKIFKEEFLKILTNEQKIIISGVGSSRIFENFPEHNNLLLKQAFIFLGKSLLKASWDAGIRDAKKSWNSSHNTLYWIHDRFTSNFIAFYKRESKLKKARCTIPNSNIQKFK